MDPVVLVHHDHHHGDHHAPPPPDDDGMIPIRSPLPLPPSVVTIGILDTGVDPAIVHHHHHHPFVNHPTGSSSSSSTNTNTNTNHNHTDDDDDNNNNNNNINIQLIDCIDCTSSGDVDVSLERPIVVVMEEEDQDFDPEDGEKKTQQQQQQLRSSSNNINNNHHHHHDSDYGYYQVVGLTGRTLKLNKEWNIQPFPVTTMATTATTTTATTTTTTTTSNSNNNNSGETPTTTGTNQIMVRLGVARGYQFFPPSLVVNADRRRRKNDVHMAALHKNLAEWYQTYYRSSSSTDDNDNNNNNDETTPEDHYHRGTTTPSSPTKAAIRQREDWQAQLEALQKYDNDDDDPGPMYDCVVFWDGTHYRAVMDVHETGDLRSAKPLTSFGVEHEYGTFSIPSSLSANSDNETVHLLNFAVQFYNRGHILSIVTDCSPHGTHVAHIAATTAAAAATTTTSAVSTSTTTTTAPLVRLISFKIGDPRLGTMETGSALIRAIRLASASKQYHCDVINISYGEAVVHPTSGQRFQKCVEECVYRYHTAIVCAAGNHGPALTTNNAPGGVLSACISIAAGVTPSMVESLYSMLLLLPPPVVVVKTNNDNNNNIEGSSTLLSSSSNENNNNNDTNTTTTTTPTTTFTWSSVGPTADGDWGVNLCAPGGAMASVPQWCLSKCQLMNGTSMASPYATGCVAWLMGACQAENIPWTPVRIRRALENTAQVLPNRSPLEQGCGMIQVHKAWEYIQMHRDDMSEDVAFRIEIVNPYNSQYSSPRGIYLRELDETMMRHSFTVRVAPKFSRVGDGYAMSKRKLDFELSVTLTASSAWVECATKILLTSDARTFDVEVDPTILGHGLHTASVIGMYQYNGSPKVLFTVPIIVAKPILPVQQIVDMRALEFQQPAEMKRFYVVPPFGSTWMDVTITDTRGNNTIDIIDETSHAVALHTVQLLDHAAYRDNECNKRFSLFPGQTHVSSIPVEARVTCEIVLARYWLTRRATSMDVRIHFRGIRPVPHELAMMAGSGGTLVRTYSDLANETIHPTGKLTKWQIPLRPVGEATITPLHDDRDCSLTTNDCENGYQMILTYKFEQEEKGSFVPRAPALQGVLYESAFESQCMFVFDGEKKFLGMTDAYPSSINAGKGTVIIRLQIRHIDPSLLEKYKNLVIWIERNLSKELTLSVYTSRENMLLGKNSFSKRTLKKGSSMAVFFAEPEHSQLPSNYACGHRFIGTVSFAATDESLPGAGKRPGGYPICYTVGPIHTNHVAIEAKSATPTVKETLKSKLEDAVRDLKIEHLSKAAKEQTHEAFNDLWDKLVLDYPDNLQLHMAKLKYLDEHPNRQENLAVVIDAANDIISRISEDDLAKGLGRRVDLEDGDSVQTNKDKMFEKDCLIEALARLAFATSELCPTENEAFHDIIRRLESWIEVDSTPKLSTLVILREMRAGMYGLALKRINVLLDDDAKGQDGTIRPMSRGTLLAKRASIFQQLGFDPLLENETRVRAVSCPKTFSLF